MRARRHDNPTHFYFFRVTYYCVRENCVSPRPLSAGTICLAREGFSPPPSPPLLRPGPTADFVIFAMSLFTFRHNDDGFGQKGASIIVPRRRRRLRRYAPEKRAHLSSTEPACRHRRSTGFSCRVLGNGFMSARKPSPEVPLKTL